MLNKNINNFEFFLKNLTNFLLLGLIYLLKHFFKKLVFSPFEKKQSILSKTQSIGLGIPPPKQLATKKAQNNDNYIQANEFLYEFETIGLDNYIFHNLRDTYAVRRWALTGDIKLVSKQLGHKSISMTEKYAQFNLRRLKKDFPTLREYIEPRLKEMRKADYFLGLSNAGKTLKMGNCANLIVPTFN